MRFFVRRGGSEVAVPAITVETARGIEVRGKHLLGIVNRQGRLETKRGDEVLIVEEDEGKEDEVA